MPDAPARLISNELEELVGLVGEADSVELKFTVPDEDRRSAAAALGVDPLDARIRQVFFFDTPELELDRSGVVVRARRTQGAPDDTVVKLRPVVPGDLPSEVRAHRDFVVEVDAMPGSYVCSGSFKGRARADVAETVAGRRPLRKLFGKRQRAFFAAHAPGSIGLDDLRVLGPVNALKLNSRPRAWTASSRSNCGSIRTARGSSSCPRNARRASGSRRPRSPATSWSSLDSTCAPSSRPRLERRSSTSPAC